MTRLTTTAILAAILASTAAAAPNGTGVGQLMLGEATWSCPAGSVPSGTKVGTIVTDDNGTVVGLAGLTACADGLAAAKHIATVTGLAVTITEEEDGTWAVRTN